MEVKIINYPAILAGTSTRLMGILIEDMDNLLISYIGDAFSVHRAFKMDGSCKVVYKTTVSDEFLKKALELEVAQNNIKEDIETIWKEIPNTVQ